MTILVGCKYTPSLDDAGLVFAESLPHSKMRQFVVGKWVYDGPRYRPELLEMCKDSGLQTESALEFALEVVKGMLKHRPRPPNASTCVVEDYLRAGEELSDNDYDSDVTESIGFDLFD